MYRSDLGFGGGPFYKVEVVWWYVMKLHEESRTIIDLLSIQIYKDVKSRISALGCAQHPKAGRNTQHP